MELTEIQQKWAEDLAIASEGRLTLVSEQDELGIWGITLYEETSEEPLPLASWIPQHFTLVELVEELEELEEVDVIESML